MKRWLLIPLLLLFASSALAFDYDTNTVNNALDVAYGGTDASTAAGARANLGLVIGTDVAAATSDITSVGDCASGACTGDAILDNEDISPTGGTWDLSATTLTVPDAWTINLANLAVNGAFEVDQEVLGAVSISTTSKYYIDMWQGSNANTSAVVNAAKVTGISDSANAGRLIVTTADTLGTDEYSHGHLYIMEIQDLYKFKNKDLCIRFNFSAKATGYYNIAFLTGNKGKSYVYNFSIPVADTTYQISCKVPITSAEIVAGTDNQGLYIHFGKVGKGVYAVGVLENWTTGVYYSGVSAVDWEATVSNYISVSDLEIYVDAFPMQQIYRSYAEELALCQRHYIEEADINVRRVVSQYNASYTLVGPTYLPVTMRKTPTVTINSLSFVGATGSEGSLYASYISPKEFSHVYNWTGGTAGHACLCTFQYTANARML